MLGGGLKRGRWARLHLWLIDYRLSVGVKPRFGVRYLPCSGFSHSVCSSSIFSGAIIHMAVASSRRCPLMAANSSGQGWLLPMLSILFKAVHGALF